MNSKKKINLIKISGEDSLGILHEITSILGEHDVNILDISQSVIHDSFSMGILFDIPEKSDLSQFYKDLLYKGYEMGIKIKFDSADIDSYNSKINDDAGATYILSLFGPTLTAKQISVVSEIVSKHGLTIELVKRLSGIIPHSSTDSEQKSSIEFRLRGIPKNLNEIKKDFMDASQELAIDIAFQKDNIFRRNRRLICFDMDSTIIQTEVIVELAREAGVGDEVYEITEAAMRGELNFKESFIKRISLLKGLDESVMQKVAERLPLTDGAERLISSLKKFGYKIAILSGGFNYFGNYLKEKLGIDYVYSNELEIVDGKLTGNHLGEIVDGDKKAEILKKLAKKENIQLEQVIAVGDGANDLPMINLAGLGIAFHAKPLVKKSAEHSISSVGLDAVLYFLGYKDSEIDNI